ncbi:DUF6262 family protein [Streptomyces sp. NPDC059582]|uniref:DUF6262 family protein n=1 Tax=Streptomyces sp. NPDC059582 TaxID=3346875 RepID=UPI0036A30AF7
MTAAENRANRPISRERAANEHGFFGLKDWRVLTKTALARIVKTGRAVSFTAVAREAGVSADFLYRHSQLRSMIERHRSKHGQVPGVRQADTGAPSSTTAAVLALSARLSQQQ